VGPDRERSQDTRMSLNSFGVIFPFPTIMIVPTILRTMYLKKPVARIEKRVIPSLTAISQRASKTSLIVDGVPSVADPNAAKSWLPIKYEAASFINETSN